MAFNGKKKNNRRVSSTDLPAAREHVAGGGGSLPFEEGVDASERLDLRVAVIVHALVRGAGANLLAGRRVLCVHRFVRPSCEGLGVLSAGMGLLQVRQR